MTLASYGMSIYSAEVDDHGIDFVAENGTKFLKFQVKSIRMDNTSRYVFVHKEYFKIDDDLLYMYLILLRNGDIQNLT